MGFLAKPLSRDSIECPKCQREVFLSTPPQFGESTDKSLFICICGWESKHE